MISRIANWCFAALLLAIALYLTIRGFTLISLGGSWYYALAGLALLGVVALLIMRRPAAGILYALIIAVTLIWSIPEAGLDLLALLPRLAAWIVVGLWFLTPWHRAAMTSSGDAKWVAGASLAGIALLVVSGFQKSPVIEFDRDASAQTATAADWADYGSTPEGTRYSALAEITPDNVTNLKEVWRFDTKIPYEYKNTPIKVGSNIFTCTSGNIVIAVDASTGKETWRFNPQNKLSGATPEALARGNTFTRGCRGVSYYEAGEDYAGQCKARILTGTTDARLIALNAETGERCSDFGEDGEVDLRQGLGPHPIFAYFHSSVPLVAGDNVVVGGWVVDNQELGNPSGALRAFNAVDGSFVWGWDVGRPGDTSFPAEGETFTLGTPNVWSIMSYDPELDLLFAPTGNASPDYYGGKRRDIDDAYNASVVAIRGATGEEVWSYRTVYHDIWDYDAPSQPTLIDIKRDGEVVPAVAQPTKRGEVFLLDRRTGEPLWPATDCPNGSAPTAAGECPVPQGPAKGDRVSPIQPFSGLPRFNAPRTEKDMWGLTPLDQLYCRIEFKKMRYEGHFTPPMPGGGVLGRDKTWGGTFQYPGNQGGYNWPSVSVDAENGLLIAQPMLLGNRIYLQTAAERAAESGREAPPASDNALTGQGPWADDTPRYGITSRFVSKWKLPFTNIASDMPCFEPPYGRLAVIDLNNNQLLWSRPIGNMRELGPFGIKPGLPFEVGTPVYGGTTTTRSGLIFQVGTLDSTFRAIDIRNGKTLWQTRLPHTANGAPITFTEDGKQYVVVAVPNNPDDGAPTGGGQLIAYALED
ncbi:outer membrane protein assembly factor BamB family protein [Henriciella litoralis]|uniref:outer membrane protein assembly factor BamB family protein n=1 Tax=Henriciella litoralis TaxID=568102 RepID=UPI0009FE848A|nr:PQQ-binding-like beta-propeller repeat protein [Henriciella litoralis]